jgi:transposase
LEQALFPSHASSVFLSASVFPSWPPVYRMALSPTIFVPNTIGRKLHLGIDEATGEIVAAVASEAGVTDDDVVPDLLEQVDRPIQHVSADGAYDKRKCYEALEATGAKVTIPPRRDAKIWQHGNSAGEPWQRDENLRAIRRVGRKQWKKESGYHRRSLAETAFFRLKTIFGATLRSRNFAQQATELFLRATVLNRMIQLGMPESYPLAA